MDACEMAPELDLPGFRFHPTEEELLEFYLKNMVYGKKIRLDIIGLLNIYHYDPTELPGLARIGEREWYFFVPRDRKHSNGGRPNRTTEKGFWKATGSDRKIVTLSDPKRIIGMKKTLVFYTGRAPRGTRTDWVMNEYRLPDRHPLPKDIVLCKIYRKATSLRVLEQRAAMEEEMQKIYAAPSSSPSSMDTISYCSEQEVAPKKEVLETVVASEDEKKDEEVTKVKGPCPSVKLPSGKDKLELNVPKLVNLDWTQDSFWTQFNSPWLQSLAPYADILNI